MTLATVEQPRTVRVWPGALLVLIASCAVLFSAFAPDFFRLQPDETTLAWQAKLARDGYAPYRDYFAYKPPLALYLPAAGFAAFGTSLAVLRILSIAALVATTVLLYLLCARTRMGVGWAVCAALALPTLFVPYWPVASAQWLALGFGLAALLCVAAPAPSPRAAFAAGLLTALAGLCVQTHGLLFAGLLAVRLATDPASRARGVLVGAIAGIATPLALTVGALWYSGLLGDAVQHVLLWPLQYYKQPGGFNDSPVEAPRTAGGAVTWTPQLVLAVGKLMLARIQLVLVTAVPMLSTVASIVMWRRGVRGPGATFALLGSFALWLVFLLGRRDQVHLVFVAPVFVYLLVQHVDWEHTAQHARWVRLAFVVALVLMVRWPVHWLQAPPSLSAVRAVDAQWTVQGFPALVAELPAASSARLPVLYLGSYGSALYFYWAPVSPPVDWLLPPSARYNSPQEFQAIAEFAEAHQVPYIVLEPQLAEHWLSDPSPIRDVLARYRRVTDSRLPTTYCRIGALDPLTGAAIC